jgi:subtilisin-like proprotein convertase family protein
LGTLAENSGNSLPNNQDKTLSVAWGDYDGDGDLDLATGNWGVNRLYKNKDGILVEAGTFGNPDEYTFGVAWGDYNGDGRLDLAVGDSGPHGNVNWLYRNDGPAAGPNSEWVFKELRGVLGDHRDYTTSLAWGDIDGDGDLDLAVGNAWRVDRLYRNDGPSSDSGWIFTEIPDSPLGGEDHTRSMAWGDYDGDGRLDLVIGKAPRWASSQGKYVGGGVYLYHNNGEALAKAGVLVGSEEDLIYSVAWGDMDGDGDLDLAAGHYGKKNRLYRNDGNGGFEFAGELGDSGDHTRSVAWGDSDGDGDLDLAVGNYGEKNRLYINEGRGVFKELEGDLGAVDDQTRSVAWGDMEGDGDLDLAVGNWPRWDDSQDKYVGGGVHFYLNSGGIFVEAGGLGNAQDHVSSVAWGDMDGDGNLDLAVGNWPRWDDSQDKYVGGGVRLYPNKGGTFAKAIVLGDEQDFTLSVSWGDMNGDNYLDLAVGNAGPPTEPEGVCYQGQVNRIYRNNRDRTFTEIPDALGGYEHPTYSVVWGDMDGDGRLDLVVGNSLPCEDSEVSRSVNLVYRNEGNEVFQAAALDSGGDDTRSVAWGDMDRDGYLDLVVGNYRTNISGQPNRLYHNNGDGTFSELLGALDEEDHTRSVAWGDMDGDGDLDLAIGNAKKGENRLYRNDGNGNFEKVEDPFLLGGSDHPRDTYSVVWGDIDGDGDLDLAIGNSGQANQVYENMRQGGLALPNNAPSLGVTAPYTSRANFYAAHTVLDSSTIPITYTIFDPEGDPVGRIGAQYSPNGGGHWLTATATMSTNVTNLSTGRWLNRAILTPTQAIPDTGVPLEVVLSVTDSAEIAEVQAWLSITHTNSADLAVALRSPKGTQVPLFTVGQASGKNLAHTRFADHITTTPLVSGAAPYIGTYRPVGNLADFQGQPVSGTWTLIITDSVGGESGTLIAWGLRVRTPAVTHVYTWNTFASGFSGQSDSVVFRMVAYPQDQDGKSNTYRYYDSSPGPFQRPYASATTFPFRVQSAPVCVYSETVASGNEATGARVYHLPKGQEDSGQVLAYTGGILLTDKDGCLPGWRQIEQGDRLFAMLPVTSNLVYDGALMFDGIDDHVVVTPSFTVPLTAATVSFWMRSEDPAASGTLFSYAGPIMDYAFLITNPGNFEIHCGSDVTTTGITADDGEWHHIAVTWDSSDGQVELYKDGDVSFTDTLTACTVISPGGSLVLGKDQNRNSFFHGALDEVRIWNVARTPAQIQDDMYGTIKDEQGLLGYWSFNDPNIATSGICENQAGSDNHGEISGATWDGISLGGYTVYHTSGEPTETGLATNPVSKTSDLVLTVTAKYRLVLFDLNVSLEWDEPGTWDPSDKDSYLTKLTDRLERASRYLYDFTDGQAALGRVTVYQNGDNWANAHVVVHAANHLRPFAAQGGIVTTMTADLEYTTTISYAPGQVHMGATWYRNEEEPDETDWERILAHELGHYLFYLDDVYLGLNERGLLIPVTTCVGSAMGDVYVDTNTEFIYSGTHWHSNCDDTLAEKTLQRTEWATIHLWYSWLVTPTKTNSGPSTMPFRTTVDIQGPFSQTEALEDNEFDLSLGPDGRVSSRVRIFLLRNGDEDETDYEYVVDLGKEEIKYDHNRNAYVTARGIQPRDRLCVFDGENLQSGCMVVSDGDSGPLRLWQDEDWKPEIQLSPVNSVTFGIQVRGVLTDSESTLRARLYPENGVADETITLTNTGGFYSNTFTLSDPALVGHVHVWVSGTMSHNDPRREAIVAYAVGGNPGIWRAGGGIWRAGGGIWRAGGGIWRAGGGIWRAGGGIWRAGGAPIISADGRMIFFTQNPDVFGEGEFYIVQSIASLPADAELPKNHRVVGQGYSLIASPSIAHPITASISFQYSEVEARDAGAPDRDQHCLSIYYWDGEVDSRQEPLLRDGKINNQWMQLSHSTYNKDYNLVSGLNEGPGIYVLLYDQNCPVD